jgi:uncharacterized membrane protein
MINIVTQMYPYRLDIKKGDPVELNIKITNLNDCTKLLSFDIVLEHDLCLEKSSLKKSQSKRLGEILAKESVSLKFNIYPFQGITPGKHKIKIKVTEHFNDYNYVESLTQKFLEINSI